MGVSLMVCGRVVSTSVGVSSPSKVRSNCPCETEQTQQRAQYSL